jgi:hypothetical protein
MAIRVSCPKCNQPGELLDQFAGRKVRCRKCKGEFIAEGDEEQDGDHCVAPTSPPPRPAVRRRDRLALGLAALALVLSIAAVCIATARDPLGAGISKYDFSSPRAALVSQMRIKLNKDIRAVIDLETQVSGKKLEEKIQTFEVRKEVEFGGKKLLFITFKEDGISKYETKAVERDATTGLWLPSYLSAYTVEETNKALAGEMRRWEGTF